ncbi:MAG: hypothetical protein HY302_11770 [Opitutae bacterium]|nr:hypothetical protein [Opitutae bacterium]
MDSGNGTAAARLVGFGLTRFEVLSVLRVGIVVSYTSDVSGPIVTDETRAGERGVSPFERREMLSGKGTYDSGQIPRVVLWRSGSALHLLLSVPDAGLSKHDETSTDHDRESEKITHTESHLPQHGFFFREQKYANQAQEEGAGVDGEENVHGSLSWDKWRNVLHRSSGDRYR